MRQVVQDANLPAAVHPEDAPFYHKAIPGANRRDTKPKFMAEGWNRYQAPLCPRVPRGMDPVATEKGA